MNEKEIETQTAYFSIFRRRTTPKIIAPLTHTIATMPANVNLDANKISVDTNQVDNNLQNSEQQIINSNNNELILNTSINTNESLIEINQRINEDGETEEIGTYTISSNQLNSNYLSNNLIEPLGTTCLMGETGSTPCDSRLTAYNIRFNTPAIYDELRYKYVDCTTGEILGRGQLCPGETGPLHHRPDGHTTKFQYEAYQCPNNLCRALPVDLCSEVSCSNYCGSNWKYYSGSCSDGVCNYSRTLCAAGCDNGNCKTGCSSGCSNYCSGSRLYYNGTCTGSQCSYSSSKICSNGCSNGACNSQTCSTGWKCIDSETKGYRNSDCSWDNEEYCDYGCSSGKCNNEPISHYSFKCDSQDEDLYWFNSLNQQEDMKEDCGNNIEGEWGPLYCDGNYVCHDRTEIDKYCMNNACQSSNGWSTEYIELCKEGCSNGKCVTLPKPGDTDYCTPEKPCQAGIGNCKKNNDCETGLRCVDDAGAKYGYANNVNVCEAALNIYNQSGWTCKNPNTMAYKFSDGSYTSELPCKHGCSNGSCYMPAFCDASTANLSELPKTQKLSFAGIDSNKEKIKLNAYIGEFVLSTAFITMATTTLIMALIGTTIMAYNDQVYESVQWPEYDDWAENQLEIHYIKHNSEFGFKDMYEFGDKCRQNYQDSKSPLKEKYIEETSSGKVFIVRSLENHMVSLVNEAGKLFACYKVGADGIINKTKNGKWNPLTTLPNCIAII